MNRIDLKNIKNIIFDLGIVLLDLDFYNAKLEFQKLGLKNLDEFYTFFHANPFFHDFETGKVTENEFIDGLRKLISKNVTDQQIINAWNTIIVGFPLQKIKFIKKLSKSYNLFMLSNTNSLHAKKYEKQFHDIAGKPLNAYFKKIYYSHIIGYRKPDPKVFSYIIDQNKINPEQTLFIDDIEQNLIPADLKSIKTYLFLPETNLFAIFNIRE